MTTTPLSHSEDAIMARIKEIKEEDFFGFQRSDLLRFVSFSYAQPHLEDDATPAQWAEVQTPRTKEAVIAKILDYMPFAWDKANNCRGLSASRSVEHMKAWLWLLDDPLHAKLDSIYKYYGKPCLRVICEKYGWDWRQWDDGQWGNQEGGPWLPPQEIAL